MWSLGSLRANWEMVMGKAKLGWFRQSPSGFIRRLVVTSLTLSPAFCSSYSSESYWRRRIELYPESQIQRGGILAEEEVLASRTALRSDSCFIVVLFLSSHVHFRHHAGLLPRERINHLDFEVNKQETEIGCHGVRTSSPFFLRPLCRN